MSIAVSYLLGAVCLIVIAQVSSNLVGLSAAVFMAGFFMSGAQTSMSLLEANFHPTLGRATGVSWMLGMGHFGAVLGAFSGGVLLSLGWGSQAIIGVLAMPAAIAALAVIVKKISVGFGLSGSRGRGARHNIDTMRCDSGTPIIVRVVDSRRTWGNFKHKRAQGAR